MFDLATARTRTGLAATDTSNDVNLQAAINLALAVTEQYCDRKFLWGVDTVRFYYTRGESSYAVDRYPITRVRSVTMGSGAPVNDFRVHSDHGLIYFGQSVINRELQISYEGGYHTLPADVELVHWNVFDFYLDMIASGSAPAVQEIESVTVPDVGTVRFSTTSKQAAAAANAINYDFSDFGHTFHLLDRYRRHFA